MEKKQFLTYDEQITFLEEKKGLMISDKEYAKKILLKIGYFPLINGYKEVFKIDNFGEPICLCMEHFQKKLGKYILVDSSELSTDIEEEQTKEEVQVEDKEEKKPAKKTTKKEATKNANGKATK